MKDRSASGGTAYARRMAWQPGRRRAQRALEDPYEGVPAHLAQPLWDWIQRAMDFQYSDERWRQVAIDLRVHVQGRPQDYFAKQCEQSPDFMLDVVEALLERYGTSVDTKAWVLDDLLEAANSAYAVAEGGRALELRVAQGVKEVLREAVDAGQGSAGDHLTSAWNAAYGRQSDPTKAYAEAIKAVEAALAPHVSPQNPKQTLGTMIADVRNKPQKWKFVLDASPTSPGVDVILGMMRSLWDGQTSRHGGASPTRLETPEEARAAVHLAAALVQFGQSAAFATA